MSDRKKCILVVLIFIMCCGYLFPAPVHAEQILGSEQQVTEDRADQVNPDISGNTIVWKDFRNGNWDIYRYNIHTKEESPVCTESHDQYSPAISGNRIVWVDTRNGMGQDDVYMFDILAGNETRITTDGGEKYKISISGNRIAWESFNEGRHGISVYDLLSQKTSFLPVERTARNGIMPDIYGQKVVYVAGFEEKSDIYVWDLSSGETRPVCGEVGSQTSPVIYGDIVVWVDSRTGYSSADIYLSELRTGVEQALCTAPKIQTLPAISGNRIIWLDCRDCSVKKGFVERNVEIYLYNLETKQEYQLVNGAAAKILPAISGKNVVWGDDRNRNWDIYLYTVNDTSADLPIEYDPSTDKPDQRSPGSASLVFAPFLALLIIIILGKKRT